jgi:hypothetical protein
MKPLYVELSQLVQAYHNCIKGTGVQDNEWSLKHKARIEKLVDEYMPSGSGFDEAVSIVIDSCHADKLSFRTGFHHMGSNGYYKGWTYHPVTVTPSFGGIHIRIGGPNLNGIKDVIHESFDYALKQEVE